ERDLGTAGRDRAAGSDRSWTRDAGGLLGAGRVDIDLVEHARIVFELRRGFENDPELVELGKDDRDLALAKSIIQDVIDGVDLDPKSRSFVTIDIDQRLQAVDLLIAGDINEFGNFFQPLK